MELTLSGDDLEKIHEGIRARYSKAAGSPEGMFRYPTGRKGLELLGYDPDFLRNLPDEVSASYCGVGNPFFLGPVEKGETVLDIGCGGGVDSLAAAFMTGSEGRVAGVDMTPEMLHRAERNRHLTGFGNVTFLEGSATDLPFPDRSFDAVLSNGVFNLIGDKKAALREVRRVLRPGGRLMIADQVLVGEAPSDKAGRISQWHHWLGGAIPGKVFLEMIQASGFTHVELVSETGFDSSPVTKGVLIRAESPPVYSLRDKGSNMNPLDKYGDFFEGVYADGVLDRKTKHLIALGASLAAGCDPWANYCLAVARELGAGEEELKEAMMVAMTVGATRIKLLYDSMSPSERPAAEPGNKPVSELGNKPTEAPACSPAGGTWSRWQRPVGRCERCLTSRIRGDPGFSASE